VRGGLERSCFTGSVFEEALFDWRVEDDLCRPLDVGLLILAREVEGRVAALLVMLPVALGGLEDIVALRVEGLTGSRLGERLDLSAGCAAWDAVESARADLLALSPVGLRRERVREGRLDMVLLFTRNVCSHDRLKFSPVG
jgi:hypothetical protein